MKSFLFLLILLVFTPPVAACPKNVHDSLSYQLRDNNRCEGLQSHQNASSGLHLISFVSFSTTNSGSIGDTLRILVAGHPKPRLEVHEFFRSYRLDQVQMSPKGNGAFFHLDSSILRRSRITTIERLRAIAYVNSDSSRTYYPTVLGKASNKYIFMLRSNRLRIFKIMRVRQLISSKPYEKDLIQSQAYPREEITAPWGYKDAPAGDYELYVVDSENNMRRFPFKHNRQWLK
jgi:hypothetical protein